MTTLTNNVLRFRFQHYQQHAAGKNTKTIDELLSALTEFEEFTNNKSFTRLDADDIVAFKEHLGTRVSKTSGKRLSATTITHKLAHLKTFFGWLMDQNEGRAIKKSVVECFNPDLRTRAAARTSKPRDWAKLSDWNNVLLDMPAGSLVKRRDRAIVALLILTGVRDAALVSLRLKHLDPIECRLTQDGTEVNTKFGKTMNTAFFPGSDVAREIIRDWHNELVSLGAEPEDPIFPVDLSDAAFLKKKKGQTLGHWTSTGPIRRIVREAFEVSGRAYVVPHTIRQTLTHEGYERNLTTKELVAWSQNLGHNSLRTTIGHYGRHSAAEVSDIMRKLHVNDQIGVRDELINRVDQLAPDAQKLVLQLVNSLGGRT